MTFRIDQHACRAVMRASGARLTRPRISANNALEHTHGAITVPLRGIHSTAYAAGPKSDPPEEVTLTQFSAVHANTTMTLDGQASALEPGMTVSAEVKMGRRRVIGFLLSPLLKYQHESGRER
jgi:multidrug efflux pump subunit AcrA (membrane-fusion protein)